MAVIPPQTPEEFGGVRRAFMVAGFAGFAALVAAGLGYKPDDVTRPYPTEEEWRLLTRSQAKHLLQEPTFFTDKVGTNEPVILSKQGDPNEVEGYDFLEVAMQKFMDNSCGLACFAMIQKISYYFATGIVPDIRIIDIFHKLRGKQYTDIRGYTEYIVPQSDAPLINDAALSPALEILDPNHELYETKELPPDYGVRDLYLFPRFKWDELFTTAKKDIIDKGGFILCFGYKYGWGHIFLITSLDENSDNPVTIVDPKPPVPQTQHQDSLQVLRLENYLEKWDDPRGGGVDPQPGLFRMVGIIPKQLKGNPIDRLQNAR